MLSLQWRHFIAHVIFHQHIIFENHHLFLDLSRCDSWKYPVECSAWILWEFKKLVKIGKPRSRLCKVYTANRLRISGMHQWMHHHEYHMRLTYVLATQGITRVTGRNKILSEYSITIILLRLQPILLWFFYNHKIKSHKMRIFAWNRNKNTSIVSKS